MLSFRIRKRSMDPSLRRGDKLCAGATAFRRRSSADYGQIACNTCAR